MEPPTSKGSNSEREKRLLSTYGRLPRGGLLGQQSKNRTYFDSGDFALSAANRVTDNGAVQTGTAHPMRDSISHPNAPVPSTSNVNKDSNRDLHGKSSPEPEMTDSPLTQQNQFEDKDLRNCAEQSRADCL
ncbi:hypothetical protein BDV29DRAFT_169155 [Aspergillus leporis]|uniref:mRNA stability protein n=1 Tax=Aspergillus leporis TaxID=41062 RepID=A0A5N5XA27_9EURO|nr:hypothetical protein BDV29DRAFT_169155 [Aspergillus leporis]